MAQKELSAKKRLAMNMGLVTAFFFAMCEHVNHSSSEDLRRVS